MTAPEYVTITEAEAAALPGLEDWRVLVGALETTFRAGSFAAAAEFVREIAAAADAADHHPDVDLRFPDRVRVRLTTHATGGLTTHDAGLASVLSSLAAARGATAEPTRAQVLELAIDTLDADRIRPFWAAVLDGVVRDGRVVDRRGTGPTVWFQECESPRVERSRLHVDVYVAHDEAQARLEAALAAGGRLVTDRFSPAWWVLADADGNEACVCTWQDEP